VNDVPSSNAGRDPPFLSAAKARVLARYRRIHALLARGGELRSPEPDRMRPSLPEQAGSPGARLVDAA
jgi:hypothetical protein